MASMIRRLVAAILLGALLPALFAGPALARDTLASRSAARPATVDPATLPPEARATLTLIARGGPFPYDKDGTVFGNFERRLPVQPRGYYREYTVKTPGERTRGARRIIAGKAGELYYTDDHYNSFRRIASKDDHEHDHGGHRSAP